MHGRFLVMVLTVLTAVHLVGCKVGPDYFRPCVSTSPHWIDQDHPRLQGQLDNPIFWWRVFNDEQLNQLIQCASSNNLTLKQAGLRVIEARCQRGIIAGGLFPQTQAALGQYHHRGRSRNNANFAAAGTQRDFDEVALGFGAAWEIDFWGRFRRAIESAEAEMNASIENYDDALVILLGEVAKTYIEIRTLERQIQLAKENTSIQAETLSLVEKKYATGLVTELDVVQAKLNLHQTESLIPVLEIQHRQFSNLLCILLAIQPVELTNLLGQSGQIPIPPGQVVIGIPADLLRQRPDIQRAEWQLAAQSARIGVAKSDFYPHLSITGTLNLESQATSKLFQADSLAGFVGPSARWDILNYWRIKNNVLLQNTVFQRLAIAYQQAILNANREVENGLISFIRTHEQIDALEKSVQASTRSLELSKLQYRAGAIDFNRVFQSQTEQVRQQDRLAAAQGELAKSLVTIYQALGGGWQIRLTDEDHGDAPHF